MAHLRSAVCAGEGESRRPGIHLDWVTGRRHRRHLHKTLLQRALRHAAVWAGGLPTSLPAPHPPPLIRDGSPRGRPRHPHAPEAAGAPRRRHPMSYRHLRNPRPATAPEHGRRDVRPMIRLAALRGICSGIGRSALQPIRSGKGRAGHGQMAATKEPGAVRRGRPPSGRRGTGSQGLLYDAGRPQWPNCS
jgi:hypothetical protein